MSPLGWIFLLLILGVIWLDPKYRHKFYRADRKTKTPEHLKGETVAYIIIKDRLGKFGITTKKFWSEKTCVRSRYKNQPLEILWTKTLPSREEAYRFESWCKVRVRIIKGKEWFPARCAKNLVVAARARWG